MVCIRTEYLKHSHSLIIGTNCFLNQCFILENDLGSSIHSHLAYDGTVTADGCLQYRTSPKMEPSHPRTKSQNLPRVRIWHEVVGCVFPEYRNTDGVLDPPFCQSFEPVRGPTDRTTVPHLRLPKKMSNYMGLNFLLISTYRSTHTYWFTMIYQYTFETRHILIQHDHAYI